MIPRKARKNPPITPGEMLREGFLDEMGLTQSELAQHLGWTPAKVNEIIQGKRRITVEIALALSDAFGNSPEFWLNAQRETDLYHARRHYRKHTRIRKAS